MINFNKLNLYQISSGKYGITHIIVFMVSSIISENKKKHFYFNSISILSNSINNNLWNIYSSWQLVWYQNETNNYCLCKVENVVAYGNTFLPSLKCDLKLETFINYITLIFNISAPTSVPVKISNATIDSSPLKLRNKTFENFSYFINYMHTIF